MKKKILLDVNSIISLYLNGFLYGVGRSTHELITALNNYDEIPFEIILFSQNLKGIGARNLQTKFKKLHFWLPNRNKTKNFSNFLKLKRLFSNYDIIHIPHNTDSWEDISKTIYTIHDLIVYRYPEMWGLTDEERKQHKFIAQNCKAIVTCSEASKNDIIKFWDVPEEKITVIPWGVNRKIFYPDLDQEININHLKKFNYFFCASCNHPRKNLNHIVESFSNYIKKGGNHNLILLKPYNFEYDKYQTLVDDRKIIIIEGISDDILRALYSQAKASILMSKYEGFGLPVLESLACGTQVICAHNSSLIEAGGEVVDYISENNLDLLTNTFLKYENLNKFETLDLEKTEKHLSNFTWENCARNYIEFYKKVLSI